MNKKHCGGCYNDDYNHGLGGAKECFHFDPKKKLIRVYEIHVDQPPPFRKNQITKRPPCFRMQRWAHVKPENINEKGYWK